MIAFIFLAVIIILAQIFFDPFDFYNEVSEFEKWMDGK